MDGMDFLNLLQNSKGLIGNSSVGIRECAFMGVPVINIGSRQNRRDRGNNVIDVGYNEHEIIQAIHHIGSQSRPTPSNVYGGGDAGKKIAAILAHVPLQFHKTIAY
jgi:UDP-N-acetylglucosamine 2-epimerase